jgi:hypothetical protein
MVDQGGFRGTSLAPASLRGGATASLSSSRPHSASLTQQPLRGSKLIGTLGGTAASGSCVAILCVALRSVHGCARLLRCGCVDPFPDADGDAVEMPDDSDAERVESSGANLGEYIDTGRLVVQQVNNPRGLQSYMVMAPEVWSLAACAPVVRLRMASSCARSLTLSVRS